MDNSCKIPEVKPITIKRFGTAGLVPTVPTTTDCNLWQKTDLKDGEFAINTVDDKLYIRSGNEIIEITNQAGSTGGSVTSVGLSMPSAFSVASSPVTSSGTISVTGAGVVSQYIRGDGSLANFPNVVGGGSSVNYYFNGSVSQGTIAGNPYYQISRASFIGPPANFTLNAGNPDLYFITDANDPGLLNIPAGNWNFQLYVSMSSSGGTPQIEAEIFTYDGSTFTSVATSVPGLITSGNNPDFYIFSVSVPNTILSLTDRLAVKLTASSLGGRTMTVYTQDTRVGQIVTSFSNGLTALNGLIEQVQYFATGSTGTDFNISSATDTHTFNIPTASAANRGLLSSADWTTFNNKLSTAITSLNSLTGASQTFATGTSGSDFSISSTGTTHTFNIPTASSSNRGLLSSTDWSTFNNKVSTGAITSSGLTMATARLLGRGTAGSGAVEEITIGSGLSLTGTTLSATGGISGLTANRFVYATSGTTVATDNDAYFDGTQIAFGTSSPIANVRTTIFGTGTTSSTWALQVHNSTGTNNSFRVRDDGRIDISAGRLHVGTTTGDGQIWFGNAASPAASTNGFINLQDVSTASGSVINIPGTDTNNETTRLELAHRGRADSFRFYPAVTGGSSISVGKGIIGKTTGAGLTFGVDFRFFGTTVSPSTIGQNEAYRFYSNDTLNGSLTNILRFQIGNGAAVVDNKFVNSYLGITDNTTITLNNAALLDLQSTTRGFLPPRMTTVEKNAISTPPAGLVVYDTTLNKLCVYTTTWETVTSI